MAEDGTNSTSFVRCNGLFITYYSRFPSKGTYFAIDVLVIVTNIALSIVGSVANGTIIASYYRNKRLRNEHTMLLCFLACTDLTITAVLQPVFVITQFGNVLGTFDHCLLWSVNSLLSFVCLCTSLLLLVIISVERFAVLRYACRYKTIVTRRRLKITVCCAWLLVLAVACSHVLFRIRQIPFLFYVMVALFSVGACFSLGIWTEKLLRHHRRSMKHTQTAGMDRLQIKARKKILRSTITTYLIVATLMVCYFPGMIMLVYEGIFVTDNPDFYFIARPCIITFMYVNSAFDPCLVLWRNSEIRNTASNIFDRTRWSGSTSSI